MKLGAEPKKVVALGVLILAGLYLFYANVLSEPQRGSNSRPASASVLPAPALVTPRQASPRRVAVGNRPNIQEFRPSLKPRKPEERLDPMSIDPTLRLDLLAKVQSVEAEGGARNLFQFTTAPAPPAPKVPAPKIVPKTPEQIAKEQQQAAEPPKPAPPPPINLKYYGYSTLRRDGKKRAFFLDGEDIFVAEEGETIKRRYKVVRIGVNSVLMEDTEQKNQQTIPLQEEAVG